MDPVRAVIDRFEGDLAVVLVGDEEYRLDVPRRFLPRGAREGDVLVLRWEIDRRETDARREKVKGLIDELRRQR
ncbi:MAG: DUF3006 domain-containing protein [Firmicutes bacterium]|nr:DUF3006 domain-containing protein [Bacillota bacterium]